MKLIDTKTGLEFEAEVKNVEPNDFINIKKSNSFLFDWDKERKGNIYKIIAVDDTEILGLLSLDDYPKEKRLFINLIEIAQQHIGKHKKVDRIAGCLIAFSASLAFKKGYLGFVSLIPKTELIDLYVNKYGFQPLGTHLFVDGKSAISLIQKYL